MPAQVGRKSTKGDWTNPRQRLARPQQLEMATGDEAKRANLRSTMDELGHRFPGVLTGSPCGLRRRRDRSPVDVVGPGRIPDDSHLWMIGQAQVVVHDNRAAFRVRNWQAAQQLGR